MTLGVSQTLRGRTGENVDMESRDLAKLLARYRDAPILDHWVFWVPEDWRKPPSHPLAPYRD